MSSLKNSVYKGPKHYLKIRLARWGASRNPFYGIVVADRTCARDGKHVDRVGTYNPIPMPDPMAYQEYLLKQGPGKKSSQKFPPRTIKYLELNVDRIKHWLGNGAHPTEKVAWLLAKAGIMPFTPKQQHKTGQVSLNDKETWDLVIRDEKGKVLAHIPKDNSDQTYFEAARKLQGKSIEKLSVKTQEALAQVTLNGEIPNREFTLEEKLFLLQQKYVRND